MTTESSTFNANNKIYLLVNYFLSFEKIYSMREKKKETYNDQK